MNPESQITHGSLFSGIGGSELAAQWLGWGNLFHCEINEFGRKVLEHYWPKSKSYEDITKTDFSVWRGRISVLSGGFPCQPYSAAGQRLGTEDDRHLWPEMLRAIREIQPTYVVGENVLGFTNWNDGLVFDEVQTELEAEGYEVQSYILPAAGVGAPHQRYRVFIVAYCDIKLLERSEKIKRGWREREQERPKIRDSDRAISGGRSTTDSSSQRSERMQSDQQSKTRQSKQGGSGRSNCKGTPSDSYREGLEGAREKRKNKRWKNTKGHTGQSIRAWNDWPTQPPVRIGNDGFSSDLDGITLPKWRKESLKAAGNAIVPQVIHTIFKTIDEHLKKTPNQSIL